MCPRCAGRVFEAAELGNERDRYCMACGWRETRIAYPHERRTFEKAKHAGVPL